MWRHEGSGVIGNIKKPTLWSHNFVNNGNYDLVQCSTDAYRKQWSKQDMQNNMWMNLYYYTVWRQNSTAAEEVTRSNISSLIRAGLVRKDIQPSKLHSNISTDSHLMMTKRDFLKNESVNMTLGRPQKGSVVKGWLSTLCCWKTPVLTLD